MDEIIRFSRENPEKTAVTIDNLLFSYGRLAADIASLATWLRRQGVDVGQSIGILIGNPYWSWLCRLAALHMGLTQVTLVSRNIPGQLAVTGKLDILLTDSGASDCAAIARQVMICAPQTMAPFAEQFAVSAVDQGPRAGQLAERARCLMLTSGTTGKQRVVSLTSEMLRGRLAALQESQALTGETRLLSTAGGNTMPGFGYMLATWRSGGCVQFVTGKETVPRLQSNRLVTTPVELQGLLNMAPAPWISREARRIIVVGGRLPVAVRDEALARAGREVVIDYGATETNCTATGDASLFDRHPGAIGYAVADARIEVVDGQGHPQPPGREGLVRTRTPYMVLGYGVDQECADEVFSDGWFYPGDLGVLFEDGLVAVTGRQTETLNISGMKAPLLDFEAPLARLSGIRDVCAIVLKLDDGDHLAFLVVCDDAVDLQSLPEKIARELPLPVPFKLLRVVSIPRNAMGKIPRNSLSEIYSKVYLREIARARQGR